MREHFLHVIIWMLDAFGQSECGTAQCFKVSCVWVEGRIHAADSGALNKNRVLKASLADVWK